ncbi:MAG: SET domain-containing protein-lysine N-methyltransferase [bacterium]|nr:SET domain-containing protein-lysine N-methyltransferase [bacterium]
MNKLLSSDKVYVSQSKIPNAGRGVFARVAIKNGEIIESCPVIEIPDHDASYVNESMLVTYIYYLGKRKERLMIALGFGSIYNHTDNPNAKYHERYKEKIIDFIAVKEIKKNEEITVNYSQGNQKDKSPLWLKTIH